MYNPDPHMDPTGPTSLIQKNAKLKSEGGRVFLNDAHGTGAPASVGSKSTEIRKKKKVSKSLRGDADLGLAWRPRSAMARARP